MCNNLPCLIGAFLAGVTITCVAMAFWLCFAFTPPFPRRKPVFDIYEKNDKGVWVFAGTHPSHKEALLSVQKVQADLKDQGATAKPYRIKEKGWMPTRRPVGMRR